MNRSSILLNSNAHSHFSLTNAIGVIDRRSAQFAGPKLISGPEFPRAYICSECVKVCVSILEDDRPPNASAVATEAPASNPLLAHPLTFAGACGSRALDSRGIKGADAAKEFAEFQTAAVSWMYLPR